MEQPNIKNWMGINILPLTYNINMTFEAKLGRANVVPYSGVEDEVLFKKFEDASLDKECLDLVWKITGDTEESQFAFKIMADHANSIIASMNTNVVHYATQYIRSMHPLYRKPELGTPGTPRYFLLRVYLNHEFECTEHPEMFLGAPLGMYHCKVCGDMQMAGMPHISEKMVDEYRASEV